MARKRQARKRNGVLGVPAPRSRAPLPEPDQLSVPLLARCCHRALHAADPAAELLLLDSLLMKKFAPDILADDILSIPRQYAMQLLTTAGALLEHGRWDAFLRFMEESAVVKTDIPGVAPIPLGIPLGLFVSNRPLDEALALWRRLRAAGLSMPDLDEMLAQPALEDSPGAVAVSMAEMSAKLDFVEAVAEEAGFFAQPGDGALLVRVLACVGYRHVRMEVLRRLAAPSEGVLHAAAFPAADALAATPYHHIGRWTFTSLQALVDSGALKPQQTRRVLTSFVSRPFDLDSSTELLWPQRVDRFLSTYHEAGAPFPALLNALATVLEAKIAERAPGVGAEVSWLEELRARVRIVRTELAGLTTQKSR